MIQAVHASKARLCRAAAALALIALMLARLGVEPLALAAAADAGGRWPICAGGRLVYLAVEDADRKDAAAEAPSTEKCLVAGLWIAADGLGGVRAAAVPPRVADARAFDARLSRGLPETKPWRARAPPVRT